MRLINKFQSVDPTVLDFDDAAQERLKYCAGIHAYMYSSL